ncbi:hypothetical protein ACFV1U_14310 [Streptomyces microflavus]|uniref:hypothetical protein n=1 Tax=Streptomyces microflavus TaxID=1919 RepID=UPI00367A4187
MPATFGTMTPGDPQSEAYARLMHGAALRDASRLTAEEEQRGQGELSRIWERLLHNAGVTQWLAPGQDLDWRGGMPHRRLRAKDGRITDLIRLIPWVLREKLSGDVFYEDVHRREERVVLARGLEPGDAASIRYRSTNPATGDGQPLQPGWEHEIERFVDLQTMLAVYTAAPYWVPPGEAFDAATGLPPEAGARLRLTAEAVMVFHDGVPLPAVIADDEELHAHATEHFGAGHDSLFEGEPLVMGGVLLARPDDGTDTALLLNPLLGWLIIANRINGQYAWAMHPVHRLDTNPGPAARVLRNYAALNALEDWDTPPPIPGQARSSGKSKGKKNQVPAAQRRRQRLEQAARTSQARLGALLGVRVLRFTAPPHQPAPPPPRGSSGSSGRAPAQYREWRRAHYTRNTRVHLLDENGRPSGPVYGPDAVEGVTFTRRRTRVKGTWINEHLPPRPGQRAVYAVDPELTRTTTPQ